MRSVEPTLAVKQSGRRWRREEFLPKPFLQRGGVFELHEMKLAVERSRETQSRQKKQESSEAPG